MKNAVFNDSSKKQKLIDKLKEKNANVIDNLHPIVGGGRWDDFWVAWPESTNPNG